MNKYVLQGFLLLLVGAVACYTGLAMAKNAGEPGSRQDPLVTKSFVEKYVKDFLNKPGDDNFQWQIKNLNSEEEFIGKAGTEFIVRTGRAVIVDPTGSGIPDITSGTNALMGQKVTLNHLFIIPRTDGRGIRARSHVIVMYRGGDI